MGYHKLCHTCKYFNTCPSLSATGKAPKDCPMDWHTAFVLDILKKERKKILEEIKELFKPKELFKNE